MSTENDTIPPDLMLDGFALAEQAELKPGPELAAEQRVQLQLLKQRSARGAVVTAGSQVLRFGVSFGSQLWLAHLLLPNDFGVVAMAAPVAGFVNLFTDLGLSQATIQRKNISQTELSSLFWINVGMSLAVSLTMVALSPLAAWMYGEPRVGPIVRALALVLPMSGLTAQMIALMNRRMQFATLSLVEVLSAVLGAVGGIVAATLHVGYWSLVVQQAAASGTLLLLAWMFSGWRPSRPAFGGEVRSLLRFGGHMTTFNVVTFFTTYIDNVLIGLLNGPFALGLFERAFRLVLGPLSQASNPIGRVALPMLARLQEDETAYRRAYLRMVQILLLLTGPGILCMSAFSYETTVTLLGEHWVGTAPMLRYLSVAGFVSICTVTSCWLMVSQDRVAEQTRCGLISSGLILLSLLAGVHWGAVGICLSYAIFSPLVHGIYVWGSTRRGPVRQRDMIEALYPIVLAILGAVLVSRLMVSRLHGVPGLRLAAGAVLCYGLTFLFLLPFPPGKKVIKGLWQIRGSLRMQATPAA